MIFLGEVISIKNSVQWIDVSIGQTQCRTSGTPPSVKSERYWEIDAFRGLALFGMLYFHFLACLVLFHILQEIPEFLYYYSPIVIVSAAFIFIAGVAIVLRYNRMLGRPMQAYYRDIAVKALVLFFIAMCITAPT